MGAILKNLGRLVRGEKRNHGKCQTIEPNSDLLNPCAIPYLAVRPQPLFEDLGLILSLFIRVTKPSTSSFEVRGEARRGQTSSPDHTAGKAKELEFVQLKI